MPTATDNGFFQLPTVGSDNGSWGGFLNANWELLDDILAGDSEITSIALTSSLKLNGASPGNNTLGGIEFGNGADAETILRVDAKAVTTQDASVYFFADTDTDGAIELSIFSGDGVDSNKAHSFFANSALLCRNGGNLSVGLDTAGAYAFSLSENGTQWAGNFETNQTRSLMSFEASGTTGPEYVGVGAEGNGMVFYTGNSLMGGIDATGTLALGHNVGINAGNAVKYNVQSISAAGAGGGFLAARFQATDDGPAFVFCKGRGTVVNEAANAVQSGDLLGQILFSGADGTDLNTTGVRIQAVVAGNVSENQVPGDLVFLTMNDAGIQSEAARITHDQELLVNATSVPAAVLSAAPSLKAYIASDAGSNIGGLWIDGDGGGGDVPFVIGDKNNAGTQEMVVYGDGDIENTNGTYATLSDIRVKQDITPAASFFDAFKKLEIYDYTLKRNGKQLMGVIAQHLENTEFAPAVIERRKDGMKSVNTTFLLMAALHTISELTSFCDTLDDRITELEAEKP